MQAPALFPWAPASGPIVPAAVVAQAVSLPVLAVALVAVV